MAESATSTSELRWYDPPIRAIIPLDKRFHVPHRLQRTIRQQPYTITLNKAFEDVMRACAEPRPKHPETWINAEIIRLYTDLHRRGYAHSIELWDGKELIGGIYGVALGRAFFGESMFSRRRNASKIALVHLVASLRQSGFTLLDTQFQTEHLAQFGTYEITRAEYHHLLSEALQKPVRLHLALMFG